MANELRVRSNFQSGIISDNPLTNSATTLNSTNLAGLPAIGSTEHAVLVLDPTGVGNGPEIVYVTAHTGSATSATIVRGREGTSGVQHASTIAWVHVATKADYEQIGATASRPSGTGLPYQYQRYYDSTLGHPLIYNGTAWVQYLPESASVTTSETTTSASYTDLATGGPAVTVTTGTSALVTIGAGNSFNSTAGSSCYMSFAVSGATTLAAADARAVYAATPSLGSSPLSRTLIVTGLTAGENTFTAKYKVSGNTGTFVNRDITVQGLL